MRLQLFTEARDIQRLSIDNGGTATSYFEILDAYVADYGESNSFWAGLRALMRLGLAFVFDGQHKPYILLAEGVTAAAVEKTGVNNNEFITIEVMGS